MEVKVTEVRLDHMKTRRQYPIFLAMDEEETNDFSTEKNTTDLVAENIEDKVARIKVIGIGQGGCNAINSMIKRGLNCVEFIAINTDAKALQTSLANVKIQIGKSITKGLGSGGNVSVGRKAMEMDSDELEKHLEDVDLVFIAAGMGGGTGTGGAPIAAAIAKRKGALVVSVVTKPFYWEGSVRRQNAEKGIAELKEHSDTLIAIENDKLLNIYDNDFNFIDLFDQPNQVLFDGVKSITDLILHKGIINIDLADVRSALGNGGNSLMGIGRSSGPNKAIEAAQKALSSPLLEGLDIRGAQHVLVNMVFPTNYKKEEFQEAMNVIINAVGDLYYLKTGLVVDDKLQDEVIITIIATGFRKNSHLASSAENLDSSLDEANHLALNPFDLIDSLPKLQNNIITTEVYNPQKQEELDKPIHEILNSSGSSKNFKLKGKENVDEKEQVESMFSEVQKKRTFNESESSKLIRSLMD